MAETSDELTLPVESTVVWMTRRRHVLRGIGMATCPPTPYPGRSLDGPASP